MPVIISAIFMHVANFFLRNFLFCIRLQPINNVEIVSGEQQRDSATDTHVSILPQTPVSSRPPGNLELSSLCYIVSPCWLSILNIAVCGGGGLVAKLCPTLAICGLQPAGLLCPWNSPGKNTGVGCRALLQGIFSTQGSNPGLLHCRQILYRLSYEGQQCVHVAKILPSQLLLCLYFVVIRLCQSVKSMVRHYRSYAGLGDVRSCSSSAGCGLEPLLSFLPVSLCSHLLSLFAFFLFPSLFLTVDCHQIQYLLQ